MIEAIVPAMRFPAGGGVNAVAVPLAVGGAMRMVGPFVTVAHALPTDFAPGTLPDDADVRPHPHIGITTLTYLYHGAITHRDSLGTCREIEPGSVAAMVAGRGIVHSERFARLRRDGGVLDLLQIWIALPDGHEDTAPAFALHPAASLPADDVAGVAWRLLTGTADGVVAPVAPVSPHFLIDVTLADGARYRLPPGVERAVHVVAGSVEIAGAPVAAGLTALIGRGEASVTARGPAHLIAFGGDPVGPRFMWWNFVHSSRAAIEAARDDWRSGRMALPADDSGDFTPAPGDRQRPWLELVGASR